MATVSVVVTAQLSATPISMDNVKFQTMVDNFVSATSGPTEGTNKQKIDWWLRQSLKRSAEIARAQGVRLAVAAAEAEAEAAKDATEFE